MVGEIRVAPGLLIAMPQLRDPNFHHSVVLMIEHQEQGAFGLVINKPTRVPVAELLSAIDVDWHGPSAEVAWAGGPVQPETGWILHEPVEGLSGNGTHEIMPGLFMSSAPEALRVLAAGPPKRVRFVLGYSGWGPSQLERELTETAWVNSDLSPDFLFDTPPEEMWEAALARIGVSPATLAAAPGIH